MANLKRRDFLAAATAAGASVVLARPLQAAAWKTKIHKALIGAPDEATLERWKAAGFEGYESTDRSASQQKAAAARKLAEKHGMRIHSVMYGWANFNHPEKVEADLASVETALLAAQAYGADTVLLVPCRISEKMPKPWEFAIRFDERTGRLRKSSRATTLRMPITSPRTIVRLPLPTMPCGG